MIFILFFYFFNLVYVKSQVNRKLLISTINKLNNYKLCIEGRIIKVVEREGKGVLDVHIGK